MAETVNHAEAAEGRLSRAVDLANSSHGADGYIYIALAEAQVHASLAIAEGQERVAEELKRVHGAIDGIAYGMGVNAAAEAERG